MAGGVELKLKPIPGPREKGEVKREDEDQPGGTTKSIWRIMHASIQ
jgi:hypothetical protein